MSPNDPVLSRSQRLRLGFFRAAAGVLLVFSVLACGALCVGLYITITEPSENRWVPAVILAVLAITLGLLIWVSIRALRVRSVDQLERESESTWLFGTKAPPSPNPSLERP
jgi:hypothetical protein